MHAVAMKLLLHSLMIFFGTLMAAGLVAPGEPERRAGGDAGAGPAPGLARSP